MPNVNVTYADMQSAANQLRNGESQIEGDLATLKKLIDNLVASGYVTDSSSKQFEASYTEFNTGATKMIQGLTGMGQYLDAAAKAFQETDSQLAAADVTLSPEVLDRIDEIVPPGTNINSPDRGYEPPSLTDSARRRR